MIMCSLSQCESGRDFFIFSLWDLICSVIAEKTKCIGFSVLSCKLYKVEEKRALLTIKMSTTNALHLACEHNDIDQVRQLLEVLTKNTLNEQDLNKRTALHIAALHGHTDILKLLLAHHDIDRSILNIWGQLAEDEAPDQFKSLFSHEKNCIEWFDTYQNAYRIAYENHSHLQQWMTKISFVRLVEEINTGYVDQIHFTSDQIEQKNLIKDYIKQAIENNDPIPLVRAYTEKTHFVTKLNEDLAKDGSDFRFILTSAMMNGIYRDNDPPKGFGAHIYAAILSHHSKLQEYRHYTGTTYRGMNITKSDFDQYEQGKCILTRTFLSSSINCEVAENFLNNQSSFTESARQRVVCIYHIRNPSIAIDVHTISVHPHENEILILPFTTFTIVHINKNLHGISYIELNDSSIINN